MEEWRIIEEFPDYMVSNLHRVKSLDRHVYHYKSKKGKFVKGQILHQYLDSNKQYLKVLLTNGSIKGKNRTIHRLVAQAFIPNPLNLPQVNHKDGNKQNNIPENLEWCTQLQNSIHSVRILGNKPPDPIYKGKQGREIPFSIPIKQIDKITNQTIKIWDCAMDASRELKIDNSSIGKAAKGRHKTSGGFKWEYV